MTETTQQAQSVPVTQTQDVAMPTTDQQTPPVAPVEPVAEPQTQVPVQSEPQSELPEDVSERTRQQFERLTYQLRQEREKRQRLEQTFQPMQPVTQAQVQPIYDPSTGLLNENVFTQTQQQAIEARQAAKKLELELAKLKEEKQQDIWDRERVLAYMSHPELDPSDKKSFNKEFVVETRKILTDSMVNPQDYGNKQLSYKEAADLAKAKVSPAAKVVEEAKAEGAQEALAQLTPKEQASLEAAGSPANRQQAGTTQEDLVKQTRQGGEAGLMAAMQRMAAMKAKG